MLAGPREILMKAVRARLAGVYKQGRKNDKMNLARQYKLWLQDQTVPGIVAADGDAATKDGKAAKRLTESLRVS